MTALCLVTLVFQIFRLTAFSPLTYGFKKGPVFSDEKISTLQRKILGTYSYGPKTKIKRGKGPMETNLCQFINTVGSE